MTDWTEPDVDIIECLKRIKDWYKTIPTTEVNKMTEINKTYQYKERQFELILKEGTPKLTVTPTRITLKLRPHFPQGDIERIEKWSLLIADKIPLDYPSMRGQFKGIRIGLQSGNKKIQKTFYFEDLDRELKVNDLS